MNGVGWVAVAVGAATWLVMRLAEAKGKISRDLAEFEVTEADLSRGRRGARSRRD